MPLEAHSINNKHCNAEKITPYHEGFDGVLSCKEAMELALPIDSAIQANHKRQRSKDTEALAVAFYYIKHIATTGVYVQLLNLC